MFSPSVFFPSPTVQPTLGVSHSPQAGHEPVTPEPPEVLPGAVHGLRIGRPRSDATEGMVVRPLWRSVDRSPDGAASGQSSSTSSSRYMSWLFHQLGKCINPNQAGLFWLCYAGGGGQIWPPPEISAVGRATTTKFCTRIALDVIYMIA